MWTRPQHNSRVMHFYGRYEGGFASLCCDRYTYLSAATIEKRVRWRNVGPRCLACLALTSYPPVKFTIELLATTVFRDLYSQVLDRAQIDVREWFGVGVLADWCEDHDEEECEALRYIHDEGPLAYVNRWQPRKLLRDLSYDPHRMRFRSDRWRLIYTFALRYNEGYDGRARQQVLLDIAVGTMPPYAGLHY